MKTRLLVMVGMMISTTIFAQKDNRDSRKPEARGYERMKQELALTDAQYESVKNIDSKYSKKRGEQRVKSERRRFEDREAMRVLHRERESDMRKIFTPDQNKKWDELQASRKDKRAYGQKHHKHGHRHKHFRNHGNDRRGGRDVERKG